MALPAEAVSARFRELQDSICRALEDEDGKGKFHEDIWERPGGGGGRTRIMRHGNVIEKGGVNFSAVHGELPENIRGALNVQQHKFFATGVSIVIHPESPMVPIIHMNVRYFEMENGQFWFGGGIDLTPHYIDEKDAGWFHQRLKEVCDRHSNEYYDRFKKWADDYFFIKHRNETRGIGGIFFDRLTGEKEKLFSFVTDVGELFAPVYTNFMRLHRDDPYGEKEKSWQLLRRGRYVEFNLVYDKGTKFGLDTSGRTESILMSLPEKAGWEYDFVPVKGSPEEKTTLALVKGMDWLNR
ncbi:MAG TPA: oxygen-dependent coproporphyrinogen oxidase [Bacteroidia bacterium]|nr:oxygen-dependent coproporphyrinogen oxidase [Bacteroidia bacterium]